MVEIFTKYNRPKTVGYITRQKSLTVPDQSYSIRELLEKFTRNQFVELNQGGQYMDNPDFEDAFNLGDLDLTTSLELQSSIAEHIAILEAEKAAAEAEYGTNNEPIDINPNE